MDDRKPHVNVGTIGHIDHGRLAVGGIAAAAMRAVANAERAADAMRAELPEQAHAEQNPESPEQVLEPKTVVVVDDGRISRERLTEVIADLESKGTPVKVITQDEYQRLAGVQVERVRQQVTEDLGELCRRVSQSGKPQRHGKKWESKAARKARMRDLQARAFRGEL